MYELLMVAEVRDWLHQLRQTDLATLMAISDALTVLRVVGPGLGRPLADRVARSALHNLKELRPGASGLCCSWPVTRQDSDKAGQ